jgi:hypothetical protein
MRDKALSGAYVDYFNETHGMVRDTMRRFVNEAVKPHIDEWEEAGAFPREIYPQAGSLGLLSIGHPTEFGGSGEQDVFLKVAASEELMRSGSGGFVASLGSLDIGLPPVWRMGSEALKAAHRAAGARGREDHCPGHHRAQRRLGRGQPQDPRGARRRPLRGQRLQDLHHLGRARRLLHRGRAHGRGGFWRRLAAADREGYAGLHRGAQSQEDGLVGLGHGRAVLPGLPRAGGKPAGAGELGLLHHHGQLPGRAPEPGHHGLP